MRKKIAIHWFRRDLRLHDNSGLQQAVASGLPVLHIYCLQTPEYDQEWLGLPSWSDIKRSFLFQSLTDLHESLKELSASLIFFRGNIIEALSQIEEYYEIALLTAAGEYAHEEQKEEQVVEAFMGNRSGSFVRHYPNSLFHPDDLPFEKGACPDVFTVFRKQLEKKSNVREVTARPESIYSLEEFSRLNDRDLEEEIRKFPAYSHRFKGGESMALERLEYYIWQTEKLAFYKKTRNQLLGDDYSSKFSPWLAWGCLSPRLIYRDVQRFEKDVVKNQSTYWLIFELIWRDFFRFHSRDIGNRLFLKSGYRDVQISWDQDSALFLKWTKGETGYPFVDANMKELNQTGFMSNRGRQNVASFLVHDLGIDWRQGATFFESQLIDYDPYSNYGNWQYVSGVGTDPRADRYFNILTQASRYDSKATFVKQMLPELKLLDAELAQQPWLLESEKRESLGIDYPERIRPLKTDL